MRLGICLGVGGGDVRLRWLEGAWSSIWDDFELELRAKTQRMRIPMIVAVNWDFAGHGMRKREKDITSPSGSRTQLSRVTGACTNRYTNGDILSDRLFAS